MLDYNADRFCPAYKKVITADLCYDSLFALNKFVTLASVRELSEIDDIESARESCRSCRYSDLNG